MHLTKKEIAIILALLIALITGGAVRLCKKGWTPASEESFMSTSSTPSSR